MRRKDSTFFCNPDDPLELIVIQPHVRFINQVIPRSVIFLERGRVFFYSNAARKSSGLTLFLIYRPQYGNIALQRRVFYKFHFGCHFLQAWQSVWLPLFPPKSHLKWPEVASLWFGDAERRRSKLVICLWFSLHMKIKAMNLAKLPVWIIVAIQIFHFGAGKCGEEPIVVNSSMRLQAS